MPAESLSTPRLAKKYTGAGSNNHTRGRKPPTLRPPNALHPPGIRRHHGYHPSPSLLPFQGQGGQGGCQTGVLARSQDGRPRAHTLRTRGPKNGMVRAPGMAATKGSRRTQAGKETSNKETQSPQAAQARDYMCREGRQNEGKGVYCGQDCPPPALPNFRRFKGA